MQSYGFFDIAASRRLAKLGFCILLVPVEGDVSSGIFPNLGVET